MTTGDLRGAGRAGRQRAHRWRHRPCSPPRRSWRGARFRRACEQGPGAARSALSMSERCSRATGRCRSGPARPPEPQPGFRRPRRRCAGRSSGIRELRPSPPRRGRCPRTRSCRGDPRPPGPPGCRGRGTPSESGPLDSRHAPRAKRTASTPNRAPNTWRAMRAVDLISINRRRLPSPRRCSPFAPFAYSSRQSL